MGQNVFGKARRNEEDSASLIHYNQGHWEKIWARGENHTKEQGPGENYGGLLIIPLFRWNFYFGPEKIGMEFLSFHTHTRAPSSSLIIIQQNQLSGYWRRIGQILANRYLKIFWAVGNKCLWLTPLPSRNEMNVTLSFDEACCVLF